MDDQYRGADEVCGNALADLEAAKARPCPWCDAHDDEVADLLTDYRMAVQTWDPADPETSTRLGQTEHRIHAAFLRRGGSRDLFWVLAEAELERARMKHPRRQASLHEGYAVLLEEVDEFWEAVKAHRADQDPHHVLVELLQVAAMACRAAVDRGLLAAAEMPSAGGAGDILDYLVARAAGRWVVIDEGAEMPLPGTHATGGTG